MKKLLFCICSIHLLLFGTAACACATLPGQTEQGVTVLAAGSQQVQVQSGISYFFETGPTTHQQAAARPDNQWTPWPDGKIVNFDTQPQAVWLHFRVRNADDDRNSWVLESLWTYINRIDMFLYDPHLRQWAAPMASGLDVPKEQRPLDYRLTNFPLNLPRGRTVDIYLRCYATSKLIVPIDIYAPDHYDSSNISYILLFSIYFGILFVMLCYNLSLSVFTKDKSYLFYSVYVLSLIFYGLMSTGFGPYYLWPSATWLHTIGYVVFSGVVFVAASLFIRSFLSLKLYGGWVYHVNTAVIVYWLLSTLAYAFKPDPAWVKLEDLAVLICSTLSMATGIYLWARGNVSARYFTLAWFVLNLGTVVMMLGLTGHMELKGIVLFGQMIGVVLELVLLSLALAERINRAKASREEAQQTALVLAQQIGQERKEGLLAQNRLLQLQRRTNEDLERQVRERTVNLEQAMGELEQTYQELAQKSITDALTQVHNRNYFNQFLDTEIERASRLGQPMALLMVDLDHFKAVNDTYGHLIGDQCLQLVAQTIRQNVIRASDLVARYGGEEFAMVLPNTTPSDAQLVADRIRTAVEELQVPACGNELRLSISVGVAGWIPLIQASAERLIQLADEALYAAKQKGRNCVEAAVVAGEAVEKTTDRETGTAYPLP